MDVETPETSVPAPSLGTIKNGVHWTAFRIYFEDTDGGGVLYHARYLNFFERARTQFLALAGFEQSALMAGNKDGYLGFVVRKAAIDYYAPARLDDILTAETRIARLGRAALDFEQRLKRGSTLTASAQIAVACINDVGRPRAMPWTMRDTLWQLINP